MNICLSVCQYTVRISQEPFIQLFRLDSLVAEDQSKCSDKFGAIFNIELVQYQYILNKQQTSWCSSRGGAESLRWVTDWDRHTRLEATDGVSQGKVIWHCMLYKKIGNKNRANSSKYWSRQLNFTRLAWLRQDRWQYMRCKRTVSGESATVWTGQQQRKKKKANTSSNSKCTVEAMFVSI